jgi:hypothetical protein
MLWQRSFNRAAIGGLVFAACVVGAPTARSATLLDEDFSGGLPASWIVNPGGSATVNAPPYCPNTGLLCIGLGNAVMTTVTMPTLSVVPGATYTVSADGAGYGTHAFDGDLVGAARFLRVLVNGNGASSPKWNLPSHDFTLNPTVVQGQLQTFTMTFVASSPTVTLSLLDDTAYPYNIGGFSVWDNVMVTGAAPVATPLPAAFPLFVTGFAAFGWLARRRQKRAA